MSSAWRDGLGNSRSCPIRVEAIAQVPLLSPTPPTSPLPAGPPQLLSRPGLPPPRPRLAPGPASSLRGPHTPTPDPTHSRPAPTRLSSPVCASVRSRALRPPCPTTWAWTCEEWAPPTGQKRAPGSRMGWSGGPPGRRGRELARGRCGPGVGGGSSAARTGGLESNAVVG